MWGFDEHTARYFYYEGNIPKYGFFIKEFKRNYELELKTWIFVDDFNKEIKHPTIN